jgi:hypothetical protein
MTQAWLADTICRQEVNLVEPASRRRPWNLDPP